MTAGNFGQAGVIMATGYSLYRWILKPLWRTFWRKLNQKEGVIVEAINYPPLECDDDEAMCVSRAERSAEAWSPSIYRPTIKTTGTAGRDRQLKSSAS